MSANTPARSDREIDASGLNCPLPILKAKKALASMERGQRLHVIATDPGSMPDFKAFSEHTGNPLLTAEEQAGKFHFIVEKA